MIYEYHENKNSFYHQRWYINMAWLWYKLKGIVFHNGSIIFIFFLFLDLKPCKSYNIDQERVRDTLNIVRKQGWNPNCHCRIDVAPTPAAYRLPVIVHLELVVANCCVTTGLLAIACYPIVVAALLLHFQVAAAASCWLIPLQRLGL